MDFQTVLGIPSGPQNLGGGVGGHEFSKAVEKADVAAARQVLCSLLSDIFFIVGLLLSRKLRSKKSYKHQSYKSLPVLQR